MPRTTNRKKSQGDKLIITEVNDYNTNASVKTVEEKILGENINESTSPDGMTLIKENPFEEKK